MLSFYLRYCINVKFYDVYTIPSIYLLVLFFGIIRQVFACRDLRKALYTNLKIVFNQFEVLIGRNFSATLKTSSIQGIVYDNFETWDK